MHVVVFLRKPKNREGGDRGKAVAERPGGGLRGVLPEAAGEEEVVA